MSITTINNFNLNNFSFDEPAKNKLGGQVVYMNYESNRLLLQTPWMPTPFGLSELVDQQSGTKKYSVDVSFREMNENPTVKAFYDKMVDLDKTLISKGQKLSSSWFGKKMKEEQVEVLYRPIVKPSKEPEKYAPTFKMKIQNPSKLQCFDINKNNFDMMNITSGCQVKAILACNSVWFVNKQFGITFSIVQLQVKPPQGISGFSFVEDDDDDIEEEEEVEEED